MGSNPVGTFLPLIFLCALVCIILVAVKVARARSAVGGSNGPADLATKVRGLKNQGRYEQAVFLVRGETGFSEDAARSFVDRV
ncbi:hypothetical protein GCM10023194_21430 [Planotetraspora phitsanulokensis]|uniref:Ribosomal protein L7/L12 C-terminal domain-containing protein n=1 Tax=Planotetraspora phitsanulokensis TaxID=575192 RepID=A0A8J3U4S9_9ACTN|nr:hypothetical protein [Planotetraspora phitsanulokensis]GII38201.1 hypothetical protein Pph01_32040 [Planotetraspora phitsanulokensis]